MRTEELVGKAQTVLRTISAESLGVTLVHEHLLLDLSLFYSEPQEASGENMAYKPVSLENLSWVRLHPLNNLDNLKLTDEQLAIKEASIFKQAGGATIVDVTNQGPTGRDPEGLARIASATGLNIIMGTGYYITPTHPPELASMKEEDIAELIIQDITIGVGNTGVRSGIIGEVGCSTPLADSERKVLRACSIAQRQTGAPIYIHPSHVEDYVMEAIQILDKAGADLRHTVIGHADLNGFSSSLCHKIVDAGCFIGFDGFGAEQVVCVDGRIFLEPPGDLSRINSIIQLITDGYLKQILMSDDIGEKVKLVSYGGYGYAHIPRDIVPLMRLKGISDEQIYTLLVENPKRLLQFGLVKE
jgi:phosphotriesterase-related protein